MNNIEKLKYVADKNATSLNEITGLLISIVTELDEKIKQYNKDFDHISEIVATLSARGVPKIVKELKKKKQGFFK